MSTQLAPIIVDADEEPTRQAPVTLFGTDNPATIVERASGIASALADVIDRRNLYTKIQGRAHVQVEGWTLLGSMLGVFAEVEWSHPLDNGWEARAVARTLNGNVVGAAEAMCTRAERTWSGRDEYAIRSMAQTRAVSKALRLPLGFIIELAGYSATPAEELNEQPEQGDAGTSGGAKRALPAGLRSGTAPAPAPAHPAAIDAGAARSREKVLRIMAARSLDVSVVEKMARDVGIPAGQHGTAEQYDLMAAMLGANDSAARAAGEAPDVVSPDGASNESTAGPAVTEAAGETPPSSAASEPPDALQERIDRANKRAAAAKPKPGSPQTVDAPEVAEQVGAAL